MYTAMEYQDYRKHWRHIHVPVEMYAYIKAIGAVRNLPQHEVVGEVLRKYRQSIDDWCEQGDCEWALMEAQGAVWDDGEWYVFMDEAGTTERRCRVPLYEFRTRVEEEYQKALKNVELSLRIAKDCAIKADKVRRQQAAAAVAAPRGSAAVVGGSDGGSC